MSPPSTPPDAPVDPSTPPGTVPVSYGGLAACQITDLDAFLESIQPTVEANFAAMEDADPARAGEGWAGTLEGACPVQGGGTVDGFPWYFRARGEGWSFCVAANVDDDPSAVGWGDPPQPGWRTGGDAQGGDAFAGSWMPYSEAWGHIEASIAAWRASRRGAGG